MPFSTLRDKDIIRPAILQRDAAAGATAAFQRLALQLRQLRAANDELDREMARLQVTLAESRQAIAASIERLRVRRPAAFGPERNRT